MSTHQPITDDAPTRPNTFTVYACPTDDGRIMTHAIDEMTHGYDETWEADVVVLNGSVHVTVSTDDCCGFHDFIEGLRVARLAAVSFLGFQEGDMQTVADCYLNDGENINVVNDEDGDER